jgi:hypothetical protein
MAKKLVLPRVHAMVLCDDLESNPAEPDVFNLYGVRTQIVVDAFPYSHPLLSVYLQLTGHSGRTRCHAIIINAETDETIFSTPSQLIELTGPLDFVPVTFQLEDCEFEEPGL